MQNNSFTFTKEAIDKITPPAFTRNNKGKVIRPEIVQHVYIFKIIKYFLQYPNYSLLFPRFNFFIKQRSI